VILAGILSVAPAQGQTPSVRLAAPSDCLANPNCGPGLERVYGVDVSSVFVPLTVADAGISALDDGLAEVAVAFSSDPEVSRPDVLTLRDDRRMVGPDPIVPVIRAKLLRTFGPRAARHIRRRLDAASAVLTTRALRSLNQQVGDGRLPEAVGGEFIDANALGGNGRRRGGPRIVVGFQDFAENETLAHLYAQTLRADGYRVSVRSVHGLRPEAVKALRAGRIGIYPGYSGSLLGYLGGTSLKRALARLGAQPMAFARAQDRNGFAMKTDVARRLGVAKLSDLARFWPAASAAQAPSEPRQDEQWAVAPSSLLDLPGAWALSQGAGVVVAVIDSGTKLDHPDLAPNVWTNFDEVPGNGVDDDHNGYIDDVHGVDLTSDRPGQDLSDGIGHGTHVAGIVAAAANRRGVVGVAFRAKIMTVRVIDAAGRPPALPRASATPPPTARA
jgi:glycine betaine/choline ABC-type transport system substrate-binding protein